MQSVDATRTVSKLRQALVSGVAPDGGWAYYDGQRSRIEPTCWAILALAGSDDPPNRHAVVASASVFLQRLQQDDGLLAEEGTPGANFAWNALALLASSTTAGTGPWSDRLSAGLLQVKGIALDLSESPVRQNNRLQAWPWTEGTFSWIEPTALCLLALKKTRAAGPLATTRIAEGEAMILDRVCDGGGWNYGNAKTLGQDLRPYVPTTALALLAMQDRRDHPAVRQSLDWLRSHAVVERAALALSLAAISLHVFGAATTEVRARIVEQEARTAFLGNRHLAAMALYALTLPDHHARAVAVP